MRVWARGELDIPSDTDDGSDKVSTIDKAAAAFGLYVETPLPQDEECYLWPENVKAFNFWMTLQRQWDIDPEGYKYRLNLPGVQVCLDNMLGVPKNERPDYFAMVQACESATLEEWRWQR